MLQQLHESAVVAVPINRLSQRLSLLSEDVCVVAERLGIYGRLNMEQQHSQQANNDANYQQYG